MITHLTFTYTTLLMVTILNNGWTWQPFFRHPQLQSNYRRYTFPAGAEALISLALHLIPKRTSHVSSVPPPFTPHAVIQVNNWVR